LRNIHTVGHRLCGSQTIPRRRWIHFPFAEIPLMIMQASDGLCSKASKLQAAGNNSDAAAGWHPVNANPA
jgi:hypothetical protein